MLSQSHSILPDYMLVFAIAILAHCPQFTDSKSVEQLLQMKTCLWFIMEPLITKNDSYCFSFYKGLLDRLKTVKDALNPDDDVVNEVRKILARVYSIIRPLHRFIYCFQKLWALCDLALTIILAKTINFEIKDVLTETKISGLFFKKVDDPLWNNEKCFLPPQLQYHVSIRIIAYDVYDWRYYDLPFSRVKRPLLRRR